MASVDESACTRNMDKDCPSGSWCCLDATNAAAPKSVCKPCDATIFGHCLENAVDLCQKSNMQPWNNFANIEKEVEDAARAMGKQAACQLWNQYIPPGSGICSG